MEKKKANEEEFFFVFFYDIYNIKVKKNQVSNKEIMV